jgi:hypothetical protein
MHRDRDLGHPRFGAVERINVTKLDIKSVETLGTLKNIVSASSKEIQGVARALRALIADVYPGVTEVPWGVQRNTGYGIGPRKQS